MGGRWSQTWAIIVSAGPAVMLAGQAILGTLAVLGIGSALYTGWKLEKWVEAKVAPVATAANTAIDEAKTATRAATKLIEDARDKLPDLTSGADAVSYLPLLAAAVAALVAINILQKD